MLSTACAAPGGCDPELCDTVPLVESDPEGGQSPALIITTPRPADGTRRAPREKRAQAAGSYPDRVSADNQRLSHVLSTATSVVETQKFFPTHTAYPRGTAGEAARVVTRDAAPAADKAVGQGYAQCFRCHSRSDQSRCNRRQSRWRRIKHSAFVFSLVW